jgi:hypothetical protein
MHFNQFIITVAVAVSSVAPPAGTSNNAAIQLSKNLRQNITVNTEKNGKNVFIPDTVSYVNIVCPETNDTLGIRFAQADSIMRDILSTQYLTYIVITSPSEYTLTFRPFWGKDGKKSFRDQNLDDFKMIQSEGKSFLEFPYHYQSGFTWNFHFKERKGEMVLIFISRTESC